MSVAIYKNGRVVPVAGNADTSLTADNITEILGYTPADSSDVSSLTVNLEDKVDKVKGKGLSTNDLTNELKTTYDDAVELVNKLGADATVEGSVAQRLAAIVANAPEKYDTLKEIATWIESDTDGAAKMQADIATLEADKLNKTEISSWAKASTKPAYTASEINMTNGASVESAIATLNSNLETEQEYNSTSEITSSDGYYKITSYKWFSRAGICCAHVEFTVNSTSIQTHTLPIDFPIPKIGRIVFCCTDNANGNICRVSVNAEGNFCIDEAHAPGVYIFDATYIV